MLNVACGSRYHKDWINIDFYADSKNIKRVNILKGLPFKNNSFDIVYSSHFFEHLSLHNAKYILKEIHRILKQDGIIRIVVPDLENICREYLKILENIEDGKDYQKKYDWIVIELLDQMIRSESGGEMGKIYANPSVVKNESLKKYILKRVGVDLPIIKRNDYKRKISSALILNKIISIYTQMIKLLVPKKMRELVFINASIGEMHKWMYDKYSLTKLLCDMNFIDIEIKDYNKSRIADFNQYFLDIKKDGTSYKGDSSLYIEAIKP